MSLDLKDSYGRTIFHSDTNNPEDYANYERARQSITSFGGPGLLLSDNQTMHAMKDANDYFAGNGNLGRPGDPSKWF